MSHEKRHIFYSSCSFEDTLTFCTQKSSMLTAAVPSKEKDVRPSHKYVRRVCWRQKTFNFEMNCLVMLKSCSFSAAGEKFFVSLRVAGAGSRGGCLNYAMLCVDVAPQYLWNLWLAPCTRSSDGMEGHTHSCVLVAQNSFLVCKFTCEKYTFANKRKINVHGARCCHHQSSSIFKKEIT